MEGAHKFFAEKFAIWIGSSTDKIAYQEQENRKFRIEEAIMAMNGQVYPVRLDPRVNEANRKVSHQIDFLRCYTIWSLFSMFLLFAFIGWTVCCFFTQKIKRIPTLVMSESLVLAMFVIECKDRK